MTNISEKKGMGKGRISLLIIFIVIIGICGYVICNGITKENKANDDKKGTELSLKSTLVKNLYSYIITNVMAITPTNYQSHKVAYKDLDEGLKNFNVYLHLNKNDIVTTKESDVCGSGGPSYATITKDVFTDMYHKIYGLNNTPLYKEFSHEGAGSCKFANDKYTCEYVCGGGAQDYMENNYLYKAEQDNNMIYLYDYYFEQVDANVYHYEQIGESTESMSVGLSSIVNIYDSSDRKNELMRYFNDEYFYKNIPSTLSTDSERYQKLYWANVKKYLGNDLKTYKHTFKKDTNSNYYWYSTEAL